MRRLLKILLRIYNKNVVYQGVEAEVCLVHSKRKLIEYMLKSTLLMFGFKERIIAQKLTKLYRRVL